MRKTTYTIAPRRVCAAAAVLAVSLTACSAANSSTEGDESERAPVTLSVILPFPAEATELAGYRLFTEKLAESAPWITIESRGGAESIPAFEQPEAVAEGVVDMTPTPATYIGGMVPMIEGNKLSPLTPIEEREAGVYAYYDRLLDDVGLHYFGQTMSNVPSKIWLNDKIDTASLEGLQIRVSGTMQPLVEALGGSPIALEAAETYTALERGVVDGVAWVDIGMANFGWNEVVKYELDEPFFESGAVALIINDEKWESLDEETQRVMTDTMIATEEEIVPLYKGFAESEKEARVASGVELITLPPAESKKFAETAEQAGWDTLRESSPDLTAELRKLYGLD